MRNCKYTMRVRVQSEDDGHFYHKEIETFGLFHQFGTDYEEFENGTAEYTVGIIETIDGSVHMIRADKIQFLPSDFCMPEFVSRCQDES